MSSIVTDDNGIPVPQYFNESINAFQVMKGSDGAILTKDINFVPNSVQQVTMIGRDGLPVAATQNGIVVDLANNSVNTMVFNGSQWVDGGIARRHYLFAMNSYAGPKATSSGVWNNGARNGLFLIQQTLGANSISKISLEIRINTVYALYKEITVPAATATLLIPFGSDDATNKFIVPAEFRVIITHANEAPFIYYVEMQLV